MAIQFSRRVQRGVAVPGWTTRMLGVRCAWLSTSRGGKEVHWQSPMPSYIHRFQTRLSKSVDETTSFVEGCGWLGQKEVSATTVRGRRWMYGSCLANWHQELICAALSYPKYQICEVQIAKVDIYVTNTRSPWASTFFFQLLPYRNIHSRNKITRTSDGRHQIEKLIKRETPLTAALNHIIHCLKLWLGENLTNPIWIVKAEQYKSNQQLPFSCLLPYRLPTTSVRYPTITWLRTKYNEAANLWTICQTT